MSELRIPLTYSINEHGCTIEHGVFLPATLIDGRCCGRKPITYKTGGLRYFCDRCTREYAPDGKQQANWAFKLLPSGDFSRDRPMSSDEAARTTKDTPNED